jgi:excinuclease ABC subunit A
VDEAIDFLGGFPDSRPGRRAVESLKLLQEVGLGYLCLGQPINTLSVGESQRLKLVRHLAEATVESRRTRVEGDKASSSRALGATKQSEGGSTLDSRPTLFLLDEPTTGLHFDDVRVLLEVFQRLVDSGHSVVVIEHNLDVIKSADWVIDLGPEAGAEGGRIVAQGTPEQIAACEASHTGRFLRQLVEALPMHNPGRADLPVGQDARQRVPTNLTVSMRNLNHQSQTIDHVPAE